MPEPLAITMIGDSLPYADGAEDELLAVLAAAEDRRVGADELAEAVHDWPTAYHLAPERAMLLAPLDIRSGDRVLDVGAGSGVNTRLCADRGAVVTAVEGSAARARLIAERNAGLGNVEVLCGPLDGLGEDRRAAFDVVLVVGVLEYAGTAPGGDGGPERLLRQVADALAPGGVVVLAIENRLGLKYLLGFPEDHLGVPWVGWEGYRPGEPTTWSRRELAGMLTDAGLAAQRWLYPFPDYKLPTTVLAEPIHDRPDGADLVDQLVGHPTSGQYAQPVFVADDRAAHRTMLTAGLGPEVANSFLVVAGRDGDAVAGRVEAGALAWRMAPDRRERWRQLAVVADTDSGVVVRRRLVGVPRQREAEGWLGQVEVAEEPYLAGRNLEQCLLDWAREGDVDAVAGGLVAWRDNLAAHEIPVASVDAPHPYLPADTTRKLPPEWLDAGPDNFVVRPEAAARDFGVTAADLTFVDREWVAAGGVDVRLAVVRGLWKAMSALLSARIHLPWPVTWSNDRLVMHLGGLIGENIDPALLQRWREAEADLIARIYCRPEERVAELHDAGSRSRMDRLRSPRAAYRRMEHQVHRQEELLAALAAPHEVAAERDGARARQTQLETELDRNRAELAHAQARLARLAWRERVHDALARLLRRRGPH